MDKKLMPLARQDHLRSDLRFAISPQAFDRWAACRTVAAKLNDTSISILEPIGGINPFTGAEGFTDRKLAAILRGIGPERDVDVFINSPGGSLHQGISIYNLLRQHQGRVNVKIISMAASAASIIAMAGDEIQVARSGFLMVHNCFVDVEEANRNDLRDIADDLEPFDVSMAEIYSERTGIDLPTVMKRMDAETIINGTAAVAEGWADALLSEDEMAEARAAAERPAAYRLEEILAKAGMSRGQRRALLRDYKSTGTPSAADRGRTPSATDDDTPRAVLEAVEALKSFSITA